MAEIGPEDITPLTATDVPQALTLSMSAQWNQNAADWLMMLSLGEGFGIRALDEQGERRLAASVVLLPYGEHFAWVSMVLVLPAFQRRRLASLLLRHALARLREQGRAGVLDATPAGHAVYLQEGFVDTWGFARYRCEAAGPPTASVASTVGPPVEALQSAHWTDIERFDPPAFGASRLPLLRSLATRWPDAARAVGQCGRLRGWMFGRDGREAHQIGPLLADDTASAQALISAALAKAPGAVYIDLLDSRKAELLPWLAEQGFVCQRPFTRMVWGATSAPGDARRIWAVAGPELG